MKAKKITAFEYAVVEVVGELDQLFRFSSFHSFGDKGFEIQETKKSNEVYVVPDGWPSDSRIHLRFQHMDERWTAFEGTIIARHLKLRFAFACGKKYLGGHYRFSGKGTNDEHLFKTLLTNLARFE